jgi:hypothetical protein
MRHRVKQAPFSILSPLDRTPSFYFRILHLLWEKLNAWRSFPSCERPLIDWSPCCSKKKNLGKKLNLLKLMKFPFGSITQILTHTWNTLMHVFSSPKIRVWWHWECHGCCRKEGFRAITQNLVYPSCDARSASSDSPWRAQQVLLLHVAIVHCSVNSSLGKMLQASRCVPY